MKDGKQLTSTGRNTVRDRLRTPAKEKDPFVATKPTKTKHGGEDQHELGAIREMTGIDFRVVSPEDIEFASYNPNSMEQEMLTSLSEQLREEGGVNQTVVVKPNPDSTGKPWVCVDGEHRVRGAVLAGIPRILVAVADYDDDKAKLKTLTYNHLRGTSVPIKLARMMVDLQRSYSVDEIARMTGVTADRQTDVLKLLQVPDFKDMGDVVAVKDDMATRPVSVNILLMPDEHGEYSDAMQRAMGLAGNDAVPLVGEQVTDYREAMKASSGIVGVKMRNIALAAICAAFNEMPEEQRKELLRSYMDKIADKLPKKKKKKKAPADV